MEHSQQPAALSAPQSLTCYKWGLAFGWTVVIALLLVINYRHERSQAVETARTQARSQYQRDLTYRHWNAAYGAVYVPVSPQIPPNPYLVEVPERDLFTTGGKHLTLVNPAYMSRLVFDLAARSYGDKGHITSLNPLRPENRPDPWETGALIAFDHGVLEQSSVVDMADGRFLRLMKPLKTETECLRCHGKQGYRVGEVRGGLSVAVPMAPLLAVAMQNWLVNAASFLLLWALGLLGIGIGARSLTRTIHERDQAEQRLIELNRDLSLRGRELEAANRELDAFCSTVSHDLRTPLTAVSGYCQLLKYIPDHDRDVEKQYIDAILVSVEKADELITALLKFARITANPLVLAEVDLSALANDIAAGLMAREPLRSAVFTIAKEMGVRADAVLLRVVMQNLMGNAWKYSSHCAETLIEVGVQCRDGRDFFFVRDNGIGFDSSHAEHVFEAFQRLPNAEAFEGAGIGLATVKRIVQRHGGRIGCEGEVGKGAIIYFSLQ
ncbi:ATP-binding protein [Geomonas azotofigens]|uniref:ATP-binding protein n=1 Tax=Geomonas azotofigens TaxID=2843196 RepID=UPI001C127C14|nr:ATP-binding protein [Geomonas azotofigens]MBU5612944.1 DUF3365 domain-containing protein [Geomonas azotofigens]